MQLGRVSGGPSEPAPQHSLPRMEAGTLLAQLLSVETCRHIDTDRLSE